ncbi:MAG TPA: DsrE family protein [Dissulfurispiraceae bacterium]|nr:DsrE family protein [Dissulfurispiraceae bacterium]
MRKLKVLFHINENERWKIAFGNINNLINDAGSQNVDIVVIANGLAVYGYTDPEKVSVIEQLSDAGVKFEACRNSIASMCINGVACIKEELLPSFVVIVPAGITEIIKRENDGYAYVKP